MTIKRQYDCDNINWEDVRTLLKEVGMSYSDVTVHELSFKNSYSRIFVFDEDVLVGCGRIISDGVRQSAIYDIAVKTDYQGQNIGRQIVDYLMNSTPGCNFILYASPGKEGFYLKLGLRKLKTGMILFANTERMQDETFVEITQSK